MSKRIKKKQLKRLSEYVQTKDTWNLDMTIAQFIVPRLELFKKVSDCYPHQFDSMEEWHEILEKMIAAFKVISCKTGIQRSEEEKSIINEGLDLFRKYYNDLWW